MRVCVAIVVSVLSIIGAGASQNPQTAEFKAEYDTSEVMTLTGNIAQVDALGPDATLLLMTRIPGLGAWAVEGDSRAALERAGWRFGADNPTVPANTAATVSVYLPSDASPAQARLMQLIEAYPPAGRARGTHTSLLKNRRFAYGLELTLADGRQLPFGSRR
ncbi:MAG: hypothetical protein ACRD3G_08240 [Vicinamibacterales bacterium]